MSNIYDKASLVLIPSGTKTSKVYSQKPTNGDGDFTFSRSTAATRVNASGNIEKETENLLLQSNNFGTTWSAPTLTITGGQSGYDGTNDAWLLDISSGTSNQRVDQTISASGVLTLSVYAKAGTLDWVRLRGDAPAVSEAYFDLSTGSLGSLVGQAIDSAIESVGGGWYRCSVSFVDATIVRIYLATADLDPIQSSGNIYIQDAQLEQGLVARDYIETTTTAVEGGITDNVPRLDYTDSSCPALLLEPQRTNAWSSSEYINLNPILSNATSADITYNVATSPEGYENAAEFDSVGGTSRIQTPYFSNNGDLVVTIFAKENSTDQIRLNTYDGTSDRSATYNLSDGSVSGVATDVTASTQDMGNGWYRCIYHRTNLAGSTNIQVFNTGGTFYIYGLQVEKDVTYPTSYIPTYGSAVTRNADDCENTSASSLIGQTEGTLFAEVYIDTTGDFKHIINAKDTSNTERMLVYLRTTNRLRFQYPSSLYDDVTITSGWYKLAVSWNGSNISFFRNGTKLVTKTDLSKSVTFSELTLGNYLGGDQLGNNMKQAISFTTALTDAECIALTTI